VTVLRAGVATDTGRVRQNNQDTPLAAEADELWAVADGMGGHRGGEVASDLAVRSLQQAYAAGEHTLDGLLDAATTANSTVNDAAAENPDLRGMGTTLVAVARTEDDELAYISVGDSRIYLLRDGELTQLTVDHSLVGELIREGSITPEEAKTHPKRNIVTRALGIDPSVQVDSASIIPYEGDRFLLCSDGLFGEVDDDRIAAVLRRLADPGDAAAELVRLANEGGGRDNITVLIVDVVDDGGRAEAASEAIDAGESHADLAGFAAHARVDDDDVAADHARATAETAARADATTAPKAKAPRRLTWRVAFFLLIVLAVLGAGTAAIGYAARGTYHVGFDGDIVTVFQGDDLLWFEPTVVERTELTRTEIRPELRNELESGIDYSSRAEALDSLTNLTTSTTSTSTTSTSTSTTSTTIAVTPSSTP
jgi:protein phosphatase